MNVYIHIFIYIYKLGGNEKKSQFFKRRGKLPYFVKKGNYRIIPIYAVHSLLLNPNFRPKYGKAVAGCKGSEFTLIVT